MSTDNFTSNFLRPATILVGGALLASAYFGAGAFAGASLVKDDNPATIVLLDDPAPVDPRVITIPEDYDVPFDARPGDTLNITMYPEGDYTTRCDDMGGRLSYDASRNLATCLDTDF